MLYQQNVEMMSKSTLWHLFSFFCLFCLQYFLFEIFLKTFFRNGINARQASKQQQQHQHSTNQAIYYIFMFGECKHKQIINRNK